jgi:hypothetical protein
MGMHLMRTSHLMNIHIIGVYLMGMHLMGMHLMGVYLMGIYLTGVYLMGTHLLGVHHKRVSRTCISMGVQWARLRRNRVLIKSRKWACRTFKPSI